MAEPRIHGISAPDKVPLRACVWPLDEGAIRRGTCVLLQGLTEFIEKYQEVADELGARGFDVVSLDWRGQGASERLAPGNRAIHVRDFDEYDLDLITLIRDVLGPVAGGGPVVALAHSMGAHILLRHLHEGGRRFTAAVMTAPMLAVDTGKFSLAMTGFFTGVLNARRPSKRIVFGSENRDPMTLPFEKNVVTRDRRRWERMQALLKKQPFLRTYGPTFGWLGAALKSIRRITARGYPEAIATPMLMVGAGADKVVHTAPQRGYAARLPNGRYVEIADAEHEILMERDSIRAQFWKEFDAFVDAQVPKDAA